MTEMGRHTFLLITFSAFVRNTPRRQKKTIPISTLAKFSPQTQKGKARKSSPLISVLPKSSPQTPKRKARKKLASLFSHTPLAQNRMFHRFQASFFDKRKRFVHRDVAALVSCLIDGQGTRGVELTSRKINVFSGMIVSVNEAREQAAFCQFAIHDSHPHTVTAV